MTDKPTTRWGLKATDWVDVRHISRGEDDARKWAASFAEGSRQTAPVDVTLFRDDGRGWEPVETFRAGGAS